MTSLAEINDGFMSESEAQSVIGILMQAKTTLKRYFVDLSNREKQGRTMAEGREGLVRLVSKIALTHEESLARNDNAADLAARLDFDSRLEDVRQQLLSLLEIVSDTQINNGIAAMAMNDRFIQILQAGRNNNAALDSALSEVDEWNKRFSKTAKPNEPSTTLPVTEQ